MPYSKCKPNSQKEIGEIMGAEFVEKLLPPWPVPLDGFALWGYLFALIFEETRGRGRLNAAIFG